jgi:hypothetical protein
MPGTEWRRPGAAPEGSNPIYPHGSIGPGTLFAIDLSFASCFTGSTVTSNDQLHNLAAYPATPYRAPSPAVALTGLAASALHPRLDGLLNRFHVNPDGHKALGIGAQGSGGPTVPARIEVPVALTAYWYNGGAPRNCAWSVFLRKPVGTNPSYVMGLHSATDESDYIPTQALITSTNTAYNAPFGAPSGNIDHLVFGNEGAFRDGQRVSATAIVPVNGTLQMQFRTISNLVDTFYVPIFAAFMTDLDAAGLTMSELAAKDLDYFSSWHVDRDDLN